MGKSPVCYGSACANIGTDKEKCYIGKRRLDKAISLYKKTYPAGSEDTFSIIWLPFYLDSDAPCIGIPLAEVFASKYEPERAQAVQQRLRQMGQMEGINFTFGGKIGNTRNAHRLVELAKTESLATQNVIMERIFEAYFEGDADITNCTTLREIAGTAGLDPQKVEDWLESDQGGQEVDHQANAARQGPGSGVPRYIIQGVHHIDGADDPSAFLGVFYQIKSCETIL